MLEEVKNKAHDANKKVEEVFQKARETNRKFESRALKVFKEHIRETDEKRKREMSEEQQRAKSEKELLLEKERIRQEHTAREMEAQDHQVVSVLYNIQSKIATSLKRANHWKEINKNRALTLNLRVVEARQRNKDVQLLSGMSSVEALPEQGSYAYDSLLKSIQK